METKNYIANNKKGAIMRKVVEIIGILVSLALIYVCSSIWWIPSIKRLYWAHKINSSQPIGVLSGNMLSYGNQQYRTVVIGATRWMAENSNYPSTFGNTWCYDNNDANCFKYGRLYDWNAALAACPEGWHLPYYEDWENLKEIVGRDGFGVGKKLKARSGWNYCSDCTGSGNGTDNFGFSALPSGKRYSDGYFSDIGNIGAWWCGYVSELWGGNNGVIEYVGYDFDVVSQDFASKDKGFSVRCVKDQRSGNGGFSETLSQQSNAGGSNTLKDSRDQRSGNGGFTETLNQQSNAGGSNTLKDSRDGKTYKTVVIGGKRWMAQNLNYQTLSGSWCYENNNSNCGKYGRLYDWNTARTVCPSGFHLPSWEEWHDLVETAGGDKNAGKKLKARSGWNENGNGTDDFGFSALPGGYRSSEGFFSAGVFVTAGDGHWWTADERSENQAWYWNMSYDYDSVGNDYYGNTSHGYSVRCVMN
jgi:uncharacterized protein (TIGR02145 family)